MTRGGHRTGAGRPKKLESEKLKQRNYYLTDKQNELVKKYIKELKKRIDKCKS